MTHDGTVPPAFPLTCPFQISDALEVTANA